MIFRKWKKILTFFLETFKNEIISICKGHISLASMKQIEDIFSRYKEIEGFMNGVWDAELFENFSNDLEKLKQTLTNEGTY